MAHPAEMRIKPILDENCSKKSQGELVGHMLRSRSVVMTLEGLPTDNARRLLDFMSGIAFALEGKITPISAKTYFVTPRNVDVLGAQGGAVENEGDRF